MNKNIIFLTIVLMSCVCVPADAFLVGDNILLSHAAPNSGDILDFVPNGSVYRNVVGGDQDVWEFAWGAGSYSVNPEYNSILIHFSSGYFSGNAPSPYGIPPYINSFNGIVISQIDQRIENLTINTNFNAVNNNPADIANGLFWNDSRVNYTGHSLDLNLAGLNAADDTYLYAYLRFEGDPIIGAVPEPMSFWLLGVGLLGSLALKKYF